MNTQELIGMFLAGLIVGVILELTAPGPTRLFASRRPADPNPPNSTLEGAI